MPDTEDGSDSLARPDAVTIACLLDAFAREFGDPTPGPRVLADRAAAAIRRGDVVALLVGEPAVGVALMSAERSTSLAGVAPRASSSTRVKGTS